MNLYVPVIEGELDDIDFPASDRSLRTGAPALDNQWKRSPDGLWNTFFLDKPELEYLKEASPYMRIVTYPFATHTADEKRQALDLPEDQAHRVVKGLVYRNKSTDEMLVVAAPNQGRINLKNLPGGKKRLRFVDPDKLPWGMDHGICTPFVPGDAGVSGIFFDADTLASGDAKPYDFSIVLGLDSVDSHQISVQMPYRKAFDLLKENFGDVVQAVNLFGNN